jgi:hypothetical protein
VLYSAQALSLSLFSHDSTEGPRAKPVEIGSSSEHGAVLGASVPVLSRLTVRNRRAKAKSQERAGSPLSLCSRGEEKKIGAPERIGG